MIYWGRKVFYDASRDFTDEEGSVRAGMSWLNAEVRVSLCGGRSEVACDRVLV